MSDRDVGSPPGWPAAIGLLVTVVGAVGFVVAFVTNASTAWLGGSLAAALLGLGVALAYWGRDLAGDEVISGPYAAPHDDVPGAAALGGDLEQSGRQRASEPGRAGVRDERHDEAHGSHDGREEPDGRRPARRRAAALDGRGVVSADVSIAHGAAVLDFHASHTARKIRMSRAMAETAPSVTGPR